MKKKEEDLIRQIETLSHSGYMAKQIAVTEDTWKAVNEIKYELMNRDKRSYTLSDTIYETTIYYRKLRDMEEKREASRKTKG